MVNESEFGIQYGMAKLKISTILKLKETIGSAEVAKGVKRYQKSQKTKELKKLLVDIE